MKKSDLLAINSIVLYLKSNQQSTSDNYGFCIVKLKKEFPNIVQSSYDFYIRTLKGSGFIEKTPKSQSPHQSINITTLGSNFLDKYGDYSSYYNKEIKWKETKECIKFYGGLSGFLMVIIKILEWIY